MTPDQRLEFERRLIAAAGKYGHENDHEFERILDEFAEQIRDETFGATVDDMRLNPPRYD